MMAFVLGAAVGYVLGARAGRERYEQIVRNYHRLAEHPTVQNAAGMARQKVTGAVTRKFGHGQHRHDRVDTTRPSDVRTGDVRTGDARPSDARPADTRTASTSTVTTIPRS